MKMRGTIKGILAGLIVSIMMFLMYAPASVNAQDVKPAPDLSNPHVRYCVDTQGVEGIEDCFKVNIFAETQIDIFVAMNLPSVDTVIGICIDKNRLPEYGKIYDAVGTLTCILEVLGGMDTPEKLNTLEL